jgi:hypothetical protein
VLASVTVEQTHLEAAIVLVALLEERREAAALAELKG